MQRLEVSGAVRPIYGSLGVRRLMLHSLWAVVFWFQNCEVCMTAGSRVRNCGD